MKKIFGHIYLFDFSSPFLGRSVADREFITALIRFGSFDEYHFFFESETILKDFQRHFADTIAFYAPNKVKTFPLYKLEEQLATTTYTVFHSSDPLIEKLIYLRSNFTIKEPFAITGYTHTLSSRNLSPGFLLTLLQQPQSCDAIICSSKCGQKVMENIFDTINNSFSQAFHQDIDYKGQLPHIPLGITTESYNRVRKDEARKKLRFPAENKIILSIARLTPSSKMDYYPILDVFSRILHEYPTARLVLAGGLSEEKENYLKELQVYAQQKGITDEIIFCPNFEDSYKHLLYSAADIFISPSDNMQETFGITIIEALASGLPVVCSDWDGYKELVTDGVTGYRVPTIMQKSYDAIDNLSLFSLNPSFIIAQYTAVNQDIMTERILSLMSNDRLLTEMAENAKRSIVCYDWSQLIPQYESLWSSLKTEALLQYTPSSFSLHFSFYKLFSHYPTYHLEDTTVLSITDAGENILANRQELSINLIIKNFLDFHLLGSLLSNLKEKPLTNADLKARHRNYTQDLVESHILWLIKYGAVAYYEKDFRNNFDI